MDTNGRNGNTFLELGWTSAHITFGRGYDLMDRKLRASAFNDFPAPTPLTNHVTPKRSKYLMSTADEIEQRIKADVKATVPLEGASVETENSYLRDVKVSKTTLYQVINETLEHSPAITDPNTLQLSPKAVGILTGPNGVQRFREIYGDYFVYGAKSRSRFNAVCTIKTSSEEARDELKTKLSASATGSASVSGALEATKQEKHDRFQSDIDIEMSGVKIDDEGMNMNTPDIDQAAAAYKTFQKNKVPEPYLGMLCHYSVVDQRIPIPKHQFQGVPKTLEKIYQDLYAAQTKLMSSNLKQAAQFAPTLSDLTDRLGDVDIMDPKEMAKIQDQVRICLIEAGKWGLRSTLLEYIKDCSIPEFAATEDKWVEAKEHKQWSAGMKGVEGNDTYGSLAAEVLYHTDNFHRTWTTGHQYGALSLGSGDRILIGLQVCCEWNDGTNGWFKITSGGVGQSTVTVDFCSNNWRGCAWEIRAWSVPKALYLTTKTN